MYRSILDPRSLFLESSIGNGICSPYHVIVFTAVGSTKALETAEIDTEPSFNSIVVLSSW
jgi:hypothetical protein